MVKFLTIFILLLIYLFCIGCEEPINLDLPSGEDKIVVEGYIENKFPPFIILTHSLPYFSNKNLEDIQKSFVHDAQITIFNGTKTVAMKEYSSDSFPGAKSLFNQLFNLASGSSDSSDSPFNKFHFYFYTNDTILNLFGEVNKTYILTIKVNEQTITAQTVIHKAVPLDSIWDMPHPDNDTLARLWIQYTDPDTNGNYVRYYTKTNREIFYPGTFGSVFDDLFFSGQSMKFSLSPGRNRNAEFERGNMGSIKKGDTIIVKWCSIDKQQFEFWRTLEQDRSGSGNPFASPIIIKSNINGGLGLWGGYDAFYDTLITKK